MNVREAVAENGFAIVPSLLGDEEVESLRSAADALAARGENIVDEEHAPIAKAIFGSHLVDDVYAALPRHPALLRPVEEVLGGPVHCFQSRINLKSSFTGGGWAWHQDFNQWYRCDGMRTPDAMIAGIFLDDVNPCNGPLMMIPRSHRRGHIYVPDTMAIPFDVVSNAASENGIAPLMGPPGTVIFFDCLTIHGSAPNISPWRRRICYLSYAAAATCDLQPLRDVFTCDPVVKPLTALPSLLPAARGEGGAQRRMRGVYT